MQDVPEPKSNDHKKKRKAKNSSPSQTTEAQTTRSQDENGTKENAAVNSSKRPRLGSPQPVVVDEFETQASREVPVNAGLTGAESTELGQSLRLTHQVSYHIECIGRLAHQFRRSDIKSPFLQDTLIHRYQNTFHRTLPHASIHSPWILSSKSPYMRLSGVRACLCLRTRAPGKPSLRSMQSHNAFVISSV